jgi:hypothetical protein
VLPEPLLSDFRPLLGHFGSSTATRGAERHTAPRLAES